MSGRIRSVKPEWGEDERMVMASEAARVLSVLLLLWADDHGNGRAGPEPLLAFKAFPRNPKLYHAAMLELVSMGYVVLYDVEGQSYFHVRTWKKHQFVKNPSKPRVPEPPAETLRRPSVDSTETLTLDPDPDPDPISRSHIPPSPRKPKRKPEDDPAAEVIREHRRLLAARGVNTSDKITESSLGNARKVMSEWPERWREVLQLLVSTESTWLKQHRWPLSSIVRFADDYDERLRNAKPSKASAQAEHLRKAAELEAQYAAEHEAVERRNREEAEARAVAGEPEPELPPFLRKVQP